MDENTDPTVNPLPVESPKGRYELRAPNPLFKGVRLGVTFENGVGYTDRLSFAQGVCEPQFAGQTKFFTLIDRQTGKQLFPVIEEADPTKDDGVNGNSAA